MLENSSSSLLFPGVSVNDARPVGDPVDEAVDAGRRSRITVEPARPESPRMFENTLPRLVRDDDRTMEVAPPEDAPFGGARGQAVRELFDRHHGRVVAFLRRLTDAERADDLAQEVFFRLFSVRNLESRDITVSYLFRIGENLVRKGYHREVRHRRAGEDLRHRAGAGVDAGADPAERHSTEMGFVSSATLQQALAELTDNEQAAIRLIVCRGLSYEQAAHSLGVNVTTINNWKHRGVRKLKTIIEDARHPGVRRERPSSCVAAPDRPARRVSGRQGEDPGEDHRGGWSSGRLVERSGGPRRAEATLVRRVG